MNYVCDCVCVRAWHGCFRRMVFVCLHSSTWFSFFCTYGHGAARITLLPLLQRAAVLPELCTCFPDTFMLPPCTETQAPFGRYHDPPETVLTFPNERVLLGLLTVRTNKCVVFAVCAVLYTIDNTRCLVSYVRGVLLVVCACVCVCVCVCFFFTVLVK